ncbi:MAG TPA: Uma2 family endonuclease [Gemmatimonadales bacterium]|nr:Uma2 family endonuclease [Gemmatimonadales bacterium]
MAVRHLVTAEELERAGADDVELVRGDLVPVTPAGGHHSALATFLTTELSVFVRARQLGRVYVELGFKLFSNPDTVRGPDVSFVSRENAAGKPRRGFMYGVPDLAIEVVSFDKTLTDLHAKAQEYLEAGTDLVWVVDPDSRRVVLYRPGRTAATLSEGDALDGGDVLPGFSLPLALLFAELD